MKISRSQECSKSELDEFNVSPNQTSIEHVIWDNVDANAFLVTSNNIEFHIIGDAASYIDLSDTEFHITGKIVKKDSTGFNSSDKVGPVNNFLSSLFKSVSIKINNTPTKNNDMVA